MLYLLLAFCLFLVILNWKNIIPVYLCLSLWINIHIKCGSMSFMGLFSLLSILWIAATHWRTVNKSPLNRYIFFFIVYLILSSIPVILFSTTMDKMGQLYQLRTAIFHIIILFVCAVNFDKETWDGYIKVLGICTMLLCLYGLFSYFTSTNYLSDILSSYYTSYDIEDMNEYATKDARFGLQSRLSGSATNPIPYGILLVMWIGFLYGVRDSFKSNIVVVVLLLLCFSNLLLTGSRGPLAALALFVIYLYYKNSKRRKKVLLILLALVVLLALYPFLSSLFEASNDVGGSSFAMRLSQAEEVLSLVSNNLDSFLWGRGFGYVSYHIETYGVSGNAHSFESVLFSVFVESGLYGVFFIFGGRVFVLWNIARRMKKQCLINIEDYKVLYGLLIMHVIYCVLVGDSYTQLFFCIYFLLIRYFIFKRKNLAYAPT